MPTQIRYDVIVLMLELDFLQMLIIFLEFTVAFRLWTGLKQRLHFYFIQ